MKSLFCGALVTALMGSELCAATTASADDSAVFGAQNHEVVSNLIAREPTPHGIWAANSQVSKGSMKLKLPMIIGIFAIVVGIAAPMPSAMASPGCHSDYSTPDSYLGCWGGNWQNQDGSSPDTYGPTGERGFIYDNRSVGSFPNMSDATLLKLGHAICQDLANGFSERAEKSTLIRSGISELDAGAVVISAQMYLC